MIAQEYFVFSDEEVTEALRQYLEGKGIKTNEDSHWRISGQKLIWTQRQKREGTNDAGEKGN